MSKLANSGRLWMRVRRVATSRKGRRQEDNPNRLIVPDCAHSLRLDTRNGARLCAPSNLHCWLRLCLWVFVIAGFAGTGKCGSVGWEFDPPRMGRLLDDGSWIHPVRLGSVNGSPEFSFPIDLVYRSTRPGGGPFGPQWYCPQLESRILPRGASQAIWETPWGSEILLEKSKSGDFRDRDGRWVADLRAGKQFVKDRDGWVYFYEAGFLQRVASPTGRRLEFTYAGGTLRGLSIFDPSSGASRLLVRVARGSGKLRDRVAELEVEGMNNRFKWSDDGDQRLLGYEAATGLVTHFGYDGNNCLAKVLSPNGEPHDFAFEFRKPKEEGKKEEGKDDGDRSKKNPANYLLVRADKERYELVETGDPGKPGYNVVLRAFLADGRTAERTAAPGRGYVATVAPDGAKTEMTYYIAPGKPFDGKLRRASVDGRLKLEYRYNRRSGLLEEVMNGEGLITFYEYPEDANAQMRDGPAPAPIRLLRGASKKSARPIAELVYDNNGKLVASKDALGNVTRYSYDVRGDLVGMTDASSVVYAFGKDDFGRVTSSAVGERKESVEYGKDGRVAVQVSPGGSRTGFKYNRLGMVEEVSVDGQVVTKLERDKTGQVIAQSDALGRQARLERDTDGRVTGVIDTGKRLTRYEYDKDGNLAKQTDAKGNWVRFERDGDGRLVRQTNAAGQEFLWKYDARGKLESRSNGVQQMRYALDTAGRMKEIVYQDLKAQSVQKVDFEYDQEGRLVQASNDDTRISNHYDEAGRLSARELSVDGETFATRYAYDAAGRRTSLALSKRGPDANFVPVQQNDAVFWPDGTLKELKANGRKICAYKRDVLTGMMSRREYGNGAVANYGYDSVGRLAWVKAEGGPLLQPLILAYGWDAASQVSRRFWNGETAVYEYDPAGQLAAVRVADNAASDLQKVANTKGPQRPASTYQLTEIYRYDLAGNLYWKSEYGEERTMAFDAANQLTHLVTPYAESTFEYDKAGRLTDERVAPSGFEISNSKSQMRRSAHRTYGYLDKVLELNGADGTRITYGYWPEGQVAWKKRFDPEGKLLDREIQLWDSLALLYRESSDAAGKTTTTTGYVAEPHVSGGAIIATFSDPVSIPTYQINDLLSTTLAVVHPDRVEVLRLTAFGSPVAQTVHTEPGAPTTHFDITTNNSAAPQGEPLGIQTTARKEGELK